MRKPKVGFLTITCPTHREAKNETGDEWVDFGNLEKVKNGLKSNGLDLVVIDDIIGYFYELDGAAKKFSDENVDVIFLYISTWNWA
ncbi:MAG: hypothetical protein H8E13_08470, partial [Actinobacteria bacterium]|nr:hypothetical protein [Actinomycetota bacterium]